MGAARARVLNTFRSEMFTLFFAISRGVRSISPRGARGARGAPLSPRNVLHSANDFQKPLSLQDEAVEDQVH